MGPRRSMIQRLATLTVRSQDRRRRRRRVSGRERGSCRGEQRRERDRARPARAPVPQRRASDTAPDGLDAVLPFDAE